MSARLFAFMAALLSTAGGTAAVAQGQAARPADPQTTDAPAAGVATPSTGSETPPAAPAAGAAGVVDPRAEAAKFARFDKLRPQGLSSDLPGIYDTLLGDAGGFRTKLYDNGIWIRGSTTNSITSDLLGENPRRPQQYTGQRPTILSVNTINAGIALDTSGDDITQINVTALQLFENWSQIGPQGFQITRLDVHKTFLDHRIEVTAGINTNLISYIGIFAGGNPLLASGLASAVPIQVGISGSSAPTPSLNVQLNGANGFYSKSGVQRSIGPDGLLAEAADNGIGLKLTRRGAKPLLIQEFGVRRAASADGRQIWLRGGGVYNTTNYRRFDRPGTGDNWMGYALADVQLYKPSASQPYRGVFLGGSALFANPDVTVIHRTLEARAYAIGMIPGRTSDAVTFTLAHNDYSTAAGDGLRARGLAAQREQWSVGLLYAAHLTRGIYVNPAVTYLRNPAFAADLKSALNAALTVTLIL